MATAKKAVKKEAPAKPKKDDFKLPKSLAECADMAYQLREERLAIQRSAEDVAKREAILREHIINNLPKSQASGISGKVANAKVLTEKVPAVEDKTKFLAYVKRTGQFDLITSSMNAKAVKERWENKKKIPGIGEVQIVKLSLTKVG